MTCIRAVRKKFIYAGQIHFDVNRHYVAGVSHMLLWRCDDRVRKNISHRFYRALNLIFFFISA
jgi:hypothetical protein